MAAAAAEEETFPEQMQRTHKQTKTGGSCSLVGFRGNLVASGVAATEAAKLKPTEQQRTFDFHTIVLVVL